MPLVHGGVLIGQICMAKDDQKTVGGEDRLRKELEEARLIYAHIRTMLEHMIAQVRAEDGRLSPQDVVIRLNDLNRAQMLLVRAERNFHDTKQSAGPAEIDFAEVRDSIGRKLDRLRATADTGGVSG